MAHTKRDFRDARQVGEPVAGLYKLRLCPKGWRVPASLDCAKLLWGRGSAWIATLDGAPIPGTWSTEEFRDLPDTHPAMRIVLYGERIDQAEYDYLSALREFARRRKPDHPCLSPLKPIDIRLLKADEF